VEPQCRVFSLGGLDATWTSPGHHLDVKTGFHTPMHPSCMASPRQWRSVLPVVSRDVV
jgi:hypothetical protein